MDDDAAVVEAPVDGVAAPPAPEPVPPGATGGGVGRVARR